MAMRDRKDTEAANRVDSLAIETLQAASGGRRRRERRAVFPGERELRKEE